MKGVVYCFHCIFTGKKYIGKTERNVEDRLRQHKSLVKKGIRRKFYNAVRKYGWEKFIFGIVDECDSDCINLMETKWIETYNTFHNGYNSTLGGEGSIGAVRSQETRNKVSKKMKNRVLSEEHKNNISKSQLGREHKDKQKQYKITFTDGRVEYICGIVRWCRNNGYYAQGLYRYLSGERSKYRDIVTVEELD
tara:strand:+ start:364 stop:942 length:579 start_codon:yes stop_codon:yes gene_type:complete